MSHHVLRTMLAASLAGLLALALSLPMPQVAMACVFIVMQPNIELVLAKSVYRLAGTLAGALAVTVLARLHAWTPAGFLAVIGCWVCLCTSLATFGTQLRAYAIVLTGYTAVIVAIPVLHEPARAGVEALLRLQEVGLGIVCAAAVSLVLRGGGSGIDRAVPAVAHAGVGPRMRSALAAALHPACAMLAVGALWLASGWAGGAMATLNTTVNCALIALAPAPRAAARQMAGGTLLALAAGVIVHAAYPLLGAPLTLALVLLPALAAGAVFTGRPGGLGFGLGYGITLCMLGLPDGVGQSLHGGFGAEAAGILLSTVALLVISTSLHRLPLPASAARAGRL